MTYEDPVKKNMNPYLSYQLGPAYAYEYYLVGKKGRRCVGNYDTLLLCSVCVYETTRRFQ